ncbi:MAG: 30S ribosome-binding factor RbfA [Myxococcota bacterium]
MAGRKRQSGPSSRPTQVGEQIRQFLSQLFLEGAFRDPRLERASMITVTEVRMSPVLRSAMVLVSVYPEDEGVVTEVFAGLVSAANEVKRAIGQNLRLRFTPDVRFRLDDSIAYGAKIEALLKEVLPPERPAPEASGANEDTEE